MCHAYNMYYSGCTGAYHQDRYGERYALNTGLTGASSNPHCTCYCPHSSSHFCNHDKIDCCAGALYDGSLLTVSRIHQRANVCQPLWVSSVRPYPIAYLRHILEVRPHIFCVPGEQVVALCYQRWGESSHACGSSHGLDTEMIATHMVQHDHIKRRGSRPLFHKPAHMETRRVGPSMNNFMNGSRIPMECKNHRRISRKVLDEGSIIHAMRMQEWRVEFHQIHDVDHAYLQFRQVMPQPP